ncbi:MAG: hypothetical protein IPJ06_13965 [Saprospiraceae bacterium]|nr:hypothetical protein [Saprospiraceae bacterium]
MIPVRSLLGWCLFQPAGTMAGLVAEQWLGPGWGNNYYVNTTTTTIRITIPVLVWK